MSESELQYAERMLVKARQAYEKALDSGKSYQSGSRGLTRYNLPELKKELQYWTNEVDRIKKGMTSRIRVGRIVIF